MRTLPLLLLVACGPAFTGDAGEVGLSADGLYVAPFEVYQGGPVLAGHDVCLTCGAVRTEVDGTAAWTSCDADGVLEACYDVAVDGASWDGACFSRPGPAGVAEVAFTPTDCDVTQPVRARVADALTLEWVDEDEVLVELDLPVERTLDELAVASPDLVRFPGGRPADWLPAPGASVQVVEGGAVDVAALLVDGAGRRVALEADRFRLGLEVVEGALREAEVTCDARELRVGPAAGARVGVRFERDGVEVPIGELIGVAAGRAASLELVVVEVAEAGSWRPWVVRAIVRDGDGEVLHGAPVRFEVDGDEVGASSVVPWAFGPGWLAFDDGCVDPAVDPQGDLRVRARFDGLSASVALAWTRGPGASTFERAETCDGPVDEDPWTPLDEAACVTGAVPVEPGCGCRAGGPATGLPVVVLLLGLRRRRPAR